MSTTVRCSSNVISAQMSSLLVMNTSYETLEFNITAVTCFSKLLTELITPCKAAKPSFTGKT